ncbi:protein-tyrosine-phosphatase [Shinella daejeonensis]|uniref:tyrosine phosphatase family protein n=1 Tax=Shinella daejeonensis TaxID=659017 RepID=UPI0020C75DD3|nr:protein-tyrosine-phosphatase [Shinella daejeonensis]MCP8893425.1 protein-tyrosine-phosphatase [Shinella daejeonensis]
MTILSVPELTICGIDELQAQSGRRVTHVLSVLDPDYPEIEAFTNYGDHHRTTLRFHDIIAPDPNRLMPQQEHVEAILRFGEEFADSRESGRDAHLLVHCHMGVSRSTAAMLALMALAAPQEEAESLFARLVAVRPQAWPNSRMVTYADELLGRKGALVTALRHHYGRQLVAQPRFSEWMVQLGRGAELDMAVPV